MLILQREIGETIVIKNDVNTIEATLLSDYKLASEFLIKCNLNGIKYAFTATSTRDGGRDLKDIPIKIMTSLDGDCIEIYSNKKKARRFSRIGIIAPKEYSVYRLELIEKIEAERVEDIKAARKAKVYIKKIQEEQ